MGATVQIVPVPPRWPQVPTAATMSATSDDTATEPSIRPETPDDADAIAAVVTAAFGSPVEARLVELLRDSGDFIPELSLVADLGGEVVAHVMITYTGLDTPAGQRRVANLAPLAVAPHAQRRGIGSALMRTVTGRADERGEPLVVLQGDPRYYGRFGFEPSSVYDIAIELPSWAPPEAAQVLRLHHYDPSLAGRIVYPPAFDEAETGGGGGRG